MGRKKTTLDFSSPYCTAYFYSLCIISKLELGKYVFFHGINLGHKLTIQQEVLENTVFIRAVFCNIRLTVGDN